MSTDPTWISDRLRTVARLRQTKPPNDLSSFASALTGFDQAAIEDACAEIEQQDKRRFPSLGQLLNQCRAIAQKNRTSGRDTHWTVDRYRLCQAFDEWLISEIVHHHKTIAELSAAHLQETKMWLAWRAQKKAGTLDCPGWCDTCEGSRYAIVEIDGERYAQPCEKCRR